MLNTSVRFLNRNSLFPPAWRLLLCCATLATAAADARAAANAVVNLSHYDALVPDFPRMRAEGVIGIIHEATYPPGSSDPRYAARAEAAVHHGMLWGAYHFANASDPIRQADQFVGFVGAEARRTGGQGTLLVLDFEKNNHYPGGTMSVSQAAAFAERVREKTGKYPGIYSNENRLRALMSSGSDSAAQAVLRKCWLWVANYHYVPGAIEPWGNWTLWQYTGDGICDLPRAAYPMAVANMHNAERNIFRGSVEGLRAFWTEHAWNGAP